MWIFVFLVRMLNFNCVFWSCVDLLMLNSVDLIVFSRMFSGGGACCICLQSSICEYEVQFFLQEGHSDKMVLRSSFANLSALRFELVGMSCVRLSALLRGCGCEIVCDRCGFEFIW